MCLPDLFEYISHGMNVSKENILLPTGCLNWIFMDGQRIVTVSTQLTACSSVWYFTLLTHLPNLSYLWSHRENGSSY